MIIPSAKLIALFAALLALPVSAMPSLNRRQGDPQTATTLDPKVIMNNLKNDGQNGAGVTPGQVRSLTSSNNFINFCLTQNVPLTNGVQEMDGSCNQTPMGRIIGVTQMPSSKFVFPENFSEEIVEDQVFDIKMAIRKMETGNFVNPNSNYYAAPQQVNGQGVVIGHSHVTIEKLPDLKTKAPLDPGVFAFFKGLNNAADGGGILSATVPGLKAGAFRMCSINAAANHQPVLVAVAQHGALDDCVYFTVKAKGAGGGNNGGNGGNNGGNGGNNGGGACKKEITVQGGQFCAALANANGITVAQLQQLNPQINAACSNLGIGQKLCVQK